MKKYFLCNMLFAVLFFGASFEFVSADAWWGKGYMEPDWVLKHGGTIINYTIANTSHPDRYKAMMFRDGKYVEVEFGKNATFDDAKNGTYIIKFYKCHKSCEDHKFNKKKKIRDKDKIVASITIVARPGQTSNLVFNASNNTVAIVGRSGIIRIDPFIMQRAKAKENEGKTCVYTQTKRQLLHLERHFFLCSMIDYDTFHQQNVNVGIVPQFLVKK